MIRRKRSTMKRHVSTYSYFQLAALIGCALLGAHCGAPEPSACRDEACLSQSRFAASAPGQPGPRTTARFDLTVPLSGGGHLAVTVAGPSEDGRKLSRIGAPFPVVVFSPGFLLGRGQYDDYLERLASHGFVAVSQAARSEANHSQYRDDTIKLLPLPVLPGRHGAQVADA